MPWGVVAGAVIGAAADAYSSDKAADAQRDASKDATKLGLYQFEQGLKEVAPFKELGLTAIPGLERMAGSKVVPFKFRDSDKFLDRYFGSEEFSVLNNQASDQILRNRSATGGLRSGGTNVDLAKIAPTLGLQALDRINAQDLERYGINQSAQADKYNQLLGLASMGANVASGNQVAGANFASSAGPLPREGRHRRPRRRRSRKRISCVRSPRTARSRARSRITIRRSGTSSSRMTARSGAWRASSKRTGSSSCAAPTIPRRSVPSCRSTRPPSCRC